MKKTIALSSMMVLVILLVLTANPGVAQEPEPTEPITDQAAVGTTFTYQGRLTDGGSPANGAYDFQFKLYDALNGGSQVGSTVPVPDQAVAEGLFTVQLDFGNIFQGDARYLEIGVRPGNSGGAYTTLSPRQALTAAPYALYALRAPWSGLSGMPAGFADGLDNDTTYSAGTGLTLTGSQFSVNTTVIQARVTGTCASGNAIRVINADGTVTCQAVEGGGGWSLTGNSGTSPATNFLGTTDNQALELRVNNARALRLEPNATSPNLIGGYSGNSVTLGVVGATIGGGGASGSTNRVTDNYGTVGGGAANLAGNNAGTTSDKSYATVGGGYSNVASDDYATVGGGDSNGASGPHATVGGGEDNTASGSHATVGGGASNEASDSDATVGGGMSNGATGGWATVGGGFGNAASGDYATVGGGFGNWAASLHATVGGGGGNEAKSYFATVGGGDSNWASGSRATVGGGDSNVAASAGAFVGGGGYDGISADGNQARGIASTIGGGYGNVITPTGSYATVAGGYRNVANGSHATVGGGRSNEASTDYAAVGGGDNNEASDYAAAVGGGYNNEASGSAATVGGGHDNEASGPAATVPGGYNNTASGNCSFAAGESASATHVGSFVWSGGAASTTSSWGNDTFTVRSHGGARFYTASGTLTGVRLSAGGNAWAAISDRNVKENFADVDSSRLLEALAAMPIQTWNLKAQPPEMRHIGPVAQDFNGMFGYLFGQVESPLHINTMDAVGVSLAASQGLYYRAQEQAARIEKLEAENAALRRQVSDLEARLAVLERMVSGGGGGQ